MPTMDLCHVPTLRALLERHGLSPTKSLGQHFLVSTGVVNAILKAIPADIQGILEIGPGPGVLTSPLSELVPRLIALEVDPIAVSALQESAPTAEVRHQDALDINLGPVFEELPEPRALVSNMPYNITGPLLTRFTAHRDKYKIAILMMQKEVGQKILAQPGNRELGSISVLIQTRFDVKHVIDAPPGAFFPPPKVQSIVLKLFPKVLDWSPQFDAHHEKLVRAGFIQPRKTLANNLTSLGIPREDSVEALRELGYHESIRPHEIKIADWDTLARRWFKSS